RLHGTSRPFITTSADTLTVPAGPKPLVTSWQVASSLPVGEVAQRLHAATRSNGRTRLMAGVGSLSLAVRIHNLASSRGLAPPPCALAPEPARTAGPAPARGPKGPDAQPQPAPRQREGRAPPTAGRRTPLPRMRTQSLASSRGLPLPPPGGERP